MNAGQSHTIKIDDRALEKWKSSNIWEQSEQIKNSIQEEIQSRLKTGNACNHFVQKIKI
jgi:hypothetical protein